MDLMTMLGGPADDFVPADADDWGPSDVDGPPDVSPPTSTDWVCEKCGREVPKRRGRRPKHILCQDHQTRTEPSNPPSTARPKQLSKDAKDEHRLKKISGDLQEGLGQLTGTLVPFMPVTGTTMSIHGPKACDAVVQAAAPFPRFLDGLEKAAMALPWMTIAQFVMAIVVASMVDMGKLEPYGIAPELLRVTEAAERAGWRSDGQRVQTKQPANEPAPVPSDVRGFTAPQPPRFNLKV